MYRITFHLIPFIDKGRLKMFQTAFIHLGFYNTTIRVNTAVSNIRGQQ